jgi:hypothetical protein
VVGKVSKLVTMARVVQSILSTRKHAKMLSRPEGMFVEGHEGCEGRPIYEIGQRTYLWSRTSAPVCGLSCNPALAKLESDVVNN